MFKILKVIVSSMREVLFDQLDSVEATSTEAINTL